jgi:carbonic anhydrase
MVGAEHMKRGFRHWHWPTYVLVFSLFSSFAAAQNQPISADQIWKNLAAGNKRYLSGKSRSGDFAAERKMLLESQHPRVAILSCSDSRVPPELIFDQGLGKLFVVRSAGENADALSIGSLEYAVEHLGTTVIVVLGHESCGAVTAACSKEKPGSVNLAAVLNPITLSCAKVDSRQPETLDMAIRDHVRRVAEELLWRSKLLKSSVAEGKLTIITAYYSLSSGEVSRLR